MQSARLDKSFLIIYLPLIAAFEQERLRNEHKAEDDLHPCRRWRKISNSVRTFRPLPLKRKQKDLQHRL